MLLAPLVNILMRIGIRIRVKSRICIKVKSRIRIRFKVKIQELWRLLKDGAMEGWVGAHNGSLKLKIDE
jgi:hypothetical protein